MWSKLICWRWNAAATTLELLRWLSCITYWPICLAPEPTPPWRPSSGCFSTWSAIRTFKYVPWPFLLVAMIAKGSRKDTCCISIDQSGLSVHGQSVGGGHRTVGNIWTKVARPSQPFFLALWRSSRHFSQIQAHDETYPFPNRDKSWWPGR